MGDELDDLLREIIEREPEWGFKRIFEAVQEAGGPPTSVHTVKRRVKKLQQAAVSEGAHGQGYSQEPLPRDSEETSNMSGIAQQLVVV